MNRLPLEKRARIIGCLTEGTSMRSATRLVDVSINTVTKLLVDVGAACDLYQHETLRNLPCKRIECDEIWSFVGAKAANIEPWERNSERGDVWTWVAIDPDSKLVPSWLVGRRNTRTATIFMKDVASRLASRVQLTTDGHRPYLNAVEEAFGSEIDYSTLTKLYASAPEAERRYSPPVCTGAHKETVTGFPDASKASTSHVERQNLSMRMGMRRFTRLTNGFSKKVQNHAYAVAIYYMHYNFGRIHKTLRVTPAMQAGIADHVWTLEEIAKLAD